MLREPDAPSPPPRPGGPPKREPAAYPAEKARGGEIILRTPQRRYIFAFGLAAVFVLALALAIWL